MNEKETKRIEELNDIIKKINKVLYPISLIMIGMNIGIWVAIGIVLII